VTTIAVIGPGAVGGALAVHLELRHPGAVCVAARTPFAGLEVRTGEALLRATPTVIDSPADGRPVDWVLITTKAYDAAPAAEWVRALIDVHSRVAVVQNGVEHVERFAPYVPTEQLVPVVVDLPAHRTAPGRVVQRGTAALTAPASSDGRRFCDLFAGTAVTARTTDDFTTAAWTKLVFNATGAITAASSAPRLTMDRPRHSGSSSRCSRRRSRSGARRGPACRIRWQCRSCRRWRCRHRPLRTRCTPTASPGGAWRSRPATERSSGSARVTGCRRP